MVPGNHMLCWEWNRIGNIKAKHPNIFRFFFLYCFLCRIFLYLCHLKYSEYFKICIRVHQSYNLIFICLYASEAFIYTFLFGAKLSGSQKPLLVVCCEVSYVVEGQMYAVQMHLVGTVLHLFLRSSFVRHSYIVFQS